MYKYLKEHEKYVLESLQNPDADLSALARYHKTQIGFLQHERLVHLLVMLAVALMALLMVLAAGISYFQAGFYSLLIAVILLVLLCFYVVHYYQLENGVQRWYVLYNRIINKSAEKGGSHVED